MIKYFSCITIIIFSTATGFAQDIDPISLKMEKFRSDVSRRNEREKELILAAVRFGLGCSKDFIQQVTSDTGKSVTTTLQDNHISNDLFATKVIEVCRSAAYRHKNISKNYWDEVEAGFLKEAILFSLLKEPR
ncbi:hypothetical protein H009_19487 [Agrobacterium tumefaciens str. Cherry 2E-2-2]|nr:hypothetical protein H009_19487 [Agrobacterium tumefaciens str. Cherry 2E-2-2]